MRPVHDPARETPSRSVGPRSDRGKPGGSGELVQGVPLGQIIKRRFVEDPTLIMVHAAGSIAAEKFRRLATTLTHGMEKPPQVMIVTSSAPGEGKTTVAVNLSLTLAARDPAREDRKTLLVDADLRRPRIGSLLAPRPRLGFAEVLGGSAPLEHALLVVEGTSLHILPAGAPAQDPLQLLESERARSLLKRIRSRYHRVVIDTPPMMPFADADSLGALSDGVLMVVRAGQTPEAVLQQGIAAVTSTRVLGTVLNVCTRSFADGKQYHDRYYHKYYTSRERKPS